MDYDSAAIRQIFQERFNDQELITFCFDYFPDVANDFGNEMSKKRKVQLLLDHCRKQRRWNALVAALQRERPDIDTTRFSPAISAKDKPRPYTPTQRNPHQIFISHAHQDAEFAQRLAADLKKHGWEIWIAPNSIQPGEKWQEAIDRGLEESGVFVLALTPDATKSRFVRDETYVAIQLVHEDKLQMLPLIVKDCELPLSWRIYQQIPFKDNYTYGLQMLLTKLQPEIMAQLAHLYQQLQEAMIIGNWHRVNSLGEEIHSRYPNYREVSQLVAQANQAKQKQAEKEKKLTFLYRRLQDAVKDREWDVALTLGKQIQAINHDYRDAVQLLAQAREGKREHDRKEKAVQLNQLLPERPSSKQDKPKKNTLTSNNKETISSPLFKQDEPQQVKSETLSTSLFPLRLSKIHLPLWATVTLGTIAVLLVAWAAYALFSSDNVSLFFGGGDETVRGETAPVMTDTAVPSPAAPVVQPPTPIPPTATAPPPTTTSAPTDTPPSLPTSTPIPPKRGCVTAYVLVWEDFQLNNGQCDQVTSHSLDAGAEVLISDDTPIVVRGPDSTCNLNEYISIQSVEALEITGWVIQDSIRILLPGEICQP